MHRCGFQREAHGWRIYPCPQPAQRCAFRRAAIGNQRGQQLKAGQAEILRWAFGDANHVRTHRAMRRSVQLYVQQPFTLLLLLAGQHALDLVAASTEDLLDVRARAKPAEPVADEVEVPFSTHVPVKKKRKLIVKSKVKNEIEKLPEATVEEISNCSACGGGDGITFFCVMGTRGQHRSHS